MSSLVNAASSRPTVIDRGWRDHAVSPWLWTPAPNQAGGHTQPTDGEAGGFMVTCAEQPGCRAYMKPLKPAESPEHARAAREKIVSDLAFDLGIIVPPVLLSKRENQPSTEEPFVCVSRVMFPVQWPWELIKRFVVDPSLNQKANAIIMAALPKSAAAGLALDTWVDQVDHDDHPHNIIFGYKQGATASGEFIFLDYAWALGFPSWRKPKGWGNDRWRNIDDPPFPPHMKRWIDPDELERVVSKIELLPEATVQEVVDRIPDQFLGRDQKSLIATGLLGRKSLVRAALKPYLERKKP